MRRFRAEFGLLWPGIGLLGSLMTVTVATRTLNDRPLHWFWVLPIRGHHALLVRLMWIGVVLLCLGWLGVGTRLRTARDARPRDVVVIAGIWAIPFVLGPALFSQDMWSYYAQGAILHLGLNPYKVAPLVLSRVGQGPLLGTVSYTWWLTPAPYGPIFLMLADGVVAIAGNHFALGLMLLRVPELFGIGLLAVFVPRLARSLGADPLRAAWLTVASPLTLLYLVAGGHNDALMAGLMVAGVSLALERRPLLGIALCTLATMVKLPAVAAIVVIGIVWLRSEPGRWRRIVASGGAVVGGLVAITAIGTGVGLSWISGSLFSTPGSVKLAITPATALAVTAWEAVHGVHANVGAAANGLEHGMVTAAMVLVVLFAAWLCLRVRRQTVGLSLGLMLLAAAVGGPAAWPWYLCWGVSVLAADPRAQRSRWLVVLLVASAFPVMAGGQVALPLPEAWEAVLLLALVVALAAAPRLRSRFGLPSLPGGLSVPPRLRGAFPRRAAVHALAVPVSPIGRPGRREPAAIGSSEPVG